MVANVWRDMEEKLLIIRTENGHVLRCTGEHPILTETGVKRAAQITIQDSIVGEFQTAEKVAEISDTTNNAENTGKEIFLVDNIDLSEDKGHFSFAEGLAVGDCLVQNNVVSCQKM